MIAGLLVTMGAIGDREQSPTSNGSIDDPTPTPSGKLLFTVLSMIAELVI